MESPVRDVGASWESTNLPRIWTLLTGKTSCQLCFYIMPAEYQQISVSPIQKSLHNWHFSIT